MSSREPRANVYSRALRRSTAVFGSIIVASIGLGCDSDTAGPRLIDSTNVVFSVVVSPESVSLAVPKTAQLAATIRTTSGSVRSAGVVSWESSKTTVAAVSKSGLVTAVAPGKAIVTATIDHQSGSATVLVDAVDHIAVFPSTASIPSGATQAFTATAYNANNEVVPIPAVKWASSNSGVATIDASGVATGVAAGLATITATAESVTANATLSVTMAASCKLVTDLSARPTSAFAKPAYLQPVTEPDFGTLITRVGGDPGVVIPGLGGQTWRQESKHNYPKDAAWSADQRLIVLKYMDGAVPGGHLYLDGDTYQPLFARQYVGAEQRWHPTLRDVQVYVTNTGSVGHWNVRTNTTVVKYAASGYNGASMGRGEGNPSYDGRYVAVQATRSSDGKAVAYVVDIDAGTKYPDIDLAAQGLTNVDWVSVSASGNYAVATATVNGVLAGLKVWDKNGTPLQTWTDFRVAHLDIGYDQAGNEVAVVIPGSGPNAKRMVMRRLSDGAVTVLSPALTFNDHVSTRNYLRRGWAYAVTNDVTGGVLDQTVFAVKLDGSAAVERLGRHRSNITDYDANPFPVPSPDGKRVMFASNWGSPTGRPVQSYVIDTRQLCPNGLAQ